MNFIPQDVKRIKETPLRRPKWLRHLRILAAAYLFLFAIFMLLAFISMVLR